MFIISMQREKIHYLQASCIGFLFPAIILCGLQFDVLKCLLWPRIFNSCICFFVSLVDSVIMNSNLSARRFFNKCLTQEIINFEKTFDVWTAPRDGTQMVSRDMKNHKYNHEHEFKEISCTMCNTRATKLFHLFYQH